MLNQYRIIILLLLPPMIGTFTSCSKAGKKQESLEQICFDRFIAMDDSLGTIRNHACEKNSLSYAIDQYVLEQKKLDYSNCSETFADAIILHQKAWIDMKAVTDKYPQLRGELHALFAVIETGKDSTLFKLKLGEIWATWRKLEAIND